MGSRRRHRGRRTARTRFAPGLDGLEVRALLSNVMVTNNLDSGPGSLRQAILNAPSGSTISFANSLKGQTIALSSGPLAISQNLSIDGPGANELSVSGSGSSQVLSVASGATVKIAGLTITDAVNTQTLGGGIANAGNLTLEGDVVSGNQDLALGFSGAEGGGIYNDGTLTVDHSQVTGNVANGNFGCSGGGIENDNGAMLTVNQSVISNNQAVTSTGISIQGGGIDNEIGSTLTITQSTVSGNSAVGGPGFIDGSNSSGGGIYRAGALTISGSTISNNEALGGTSGIGTRPSAARCSSPPRRRMASCLPPRST